MHHVYFCNLLSDVDDIFRLVRGRVKHADRNVLGPGDGKHPAEEQRRDGEDEDGHGGGLEVPLRVERADDTETPFTGDDG